MKPLAEHDGLALVEIEVNDLPRVWAHVAPLLARGCKFSFGAYTPETLGEDVYQGRKRLWVLVDENGPNSAMTIQISVADTGKRFLDVCVVGGSDMARWAPFKAHLDKLGRSYGCEEKRAVVRKGMAEKLKADGWGVAAFVMMERIEQMEEADGRPIDA